MESYEIKSAREIAAQFYDKRDPLAFNFAYRDAAHNIRRGRGDDLESVALARFAIAEASEAEREACIRILEDMRFSSDRDGWTEYGQLRDDLLVRAIAKLNARYPA